MNLQKFKEYIDLYYGENRCYYFQNAEDSKIPFRFFALIDQFNDVLFRISPLIGCEKHFSDFVIKKDEFKLLSDYCEMMSQNLKISDLEHVVKFGCTSFTSINGGETYAEKNKPLFYTDEELKYCIRKYGSWKVFKAKFKYNFRRRIYFSAWWLCHLFGLNLYSKNEVTAAVYQACQILRQELKPGETLEDKIIQQVEKNSSSNSSIPLPNNNFFSIEDSISMKIKATPPLPSKLLPKIEFKEISDDFKNRRQEIKEKLNPTNNPPKVNRLQKF